MPKLKEPRARLTKNKRHLEIRKKEQGTICLLSHQNTMFKQVFIGVLLGLLSSFMAQVQARTLFIDFNNAESEIAVFRQNRQGVASEVVVVPSYQRITRQQRLHILRTNEALERYTVKVQDCAVAEKLEKKRDAKRDAVRDAKCDSYYDHIFALEQERERKTKTPFLSTWS
jgi:hypothetical protein